MDDVLLSFDIDAAISCKVKGRDRIPDEFKLPGKRVKYFNLLQR